MVINSVSVFKYTLTRAGFGGLGLALAGWLLRLNGLAVAPALVSGSATAGLLALGLTLLLTESYRLDPQARQLYFRRTLLGRQSESPSCSYDAIQGIGVDALKIERERGGPLYYYGLRLVLNNGRKLELEPLHDLSFDKTVRRGEELAARLELKWLKSKPRQQLKARRQRGRARG